MDDAPESGSGDQTAEPFEGGLYGVASLLSGWAPSLTAALLDEDRRRQHTLLTLATRFPQAFAGANRALELATAAVDFVGHSDFEPLGELVRRTASNLKISFDGVLTRRESVVMDTCRDQMEIAALAQDFLHEPQRIPKWLLGKDRAREFGFKRLIEKHESDLLVLPTGGRPELLREYAAHSEGLHPRADAVNPVSLPKVPVPSSLEWWLPMTMREVLHHAHATLAQLDLALCFHLKREDWPLGVVNAADDDPLLVAIGQLAQLQTQMRAQANLDLPGI
ncbi:hypothetical protein [Curtobacterium sp. MCLR17_044]|uniref:hypothetical protein n=1 Tax=Curtobacterium sp. MCLR17_044 TaxID=2175628 RepID=UPI000DAA3E0D|nr:hypothetical protein [Curtobacterium sp. MCLR17_044]PZE62003.1 hypothetical protein DEJ04_03530 [Curtobacterium sp. MCLR17_044]